MITRRSAALSPLALLLLGGEAVAEADLVFPLDTSGARPSVQLSVAGGQAEPWIFDTGAGGSVISDQRAQALGLPNNGVQLVGSPLGGQPVEAFRTTVSGARIGDVQLPDFSAVAMPLPPQLHHSGVLSPNIFRGRLVRLVFARNEVRVTDRANAPAGTPTPYAGAHHPLPAIDVEVAGQTHLAHMDTGAPQLISFPYALASSLPLASAPVEAGRMRFVDGERARYTAQIVGAVQIGPLTLNNPQIDMVDGLPYANVGTEALRHLTVTLDPERRVGWAELA
jgi:hypothetical protein